MFKQRIQDMLKMAETIANAAENEADNFKDVPGDVALRMFAESIRRTNEKAADIPSPLN